MAAVLLRLEREDIKRYERICQHISRILPVFDRFQIEESYGKVLLRWKAKWTDKTFGAHLTSDGSLRFFSLVTLLNLPPEMLPDVLLLDEPELGLHPAAVALIGGMIKSLAEERQVIVATQSPLLVDEFGLDEIFVLELQDGRTEFRKLSPDDYQVWLDDNFTSGELWQKNLLGGRP
ncbi:MAG: AAA family ATPase [Gemmatimonadetes bacterium]|nr:AAA family ATPase [Gemmatimonadota bacterium]